MPRLTIWIVRAALLYFGVGFTLCALILFHKGIPYWAGAWKLLPMHFEFLFLGWTAQLVFGVEFWILPRFKYPPVRGNERLAWSAFILLNSGVLLAGVGAWLSA